MKVLTIGHATLDLFFKLPAAHIHEVDLEVAELCLPFPDKIMIDEMETSLGGNAPNVGSGLIKLGHQAALSSEIGQDFFGEAVLKILQESGFDLGFVRRGRSSDVSVILTHRGERTILSHHPKGREWDFKFDDISAGAVYLSSLGTPKFQKLHEALIDWLRSPSSALRHPPSIFYNPGKDELDVGINGLPILKNTHVLYVNKQEAARLLGRGVDDEDVSSETMRQLSAGIHRAGPKIVIITDGTNGSFGYNGSDFYHQPIFPCEAVERTGAGDAFSSGSMAAFLDGEDLPDALRWGAAQAASVVAQIGATNGLLTRGELDEILTQHE